MIISNYIIIILIIRYVVFIMYCCFVVVVVVDMFLPMTEMLFSIVVTTGYVVPVRCGMKCENEI